MNQVSCLAHFQRHTSQLEGINLLLILIYYVFILH